MGQQKQPFILTAIILWESLTFFFFFLVESIYTVIFLIILDGKEREGILMVNEVELSRLLNHRHCPIEKLKMTVVLIIKVKWNRWISPTNLGTHGPA